ncbi:MAG: hypothetical protein ACI376_00655 [Candidatus Bruticola sp.]
MAYTLICYIIPLILLVIALCMLISDLIFMRREKKNGIETGFSSVWFIVRVVKIISILGVAYAMYTLDPQFLQARPENAPPADAAALNSYNWQWNIIFVMILIFSASFVTDVFGRLRLLQTSEDKRAEKFFQLSTDLSSEHQS